MKGGELSLGAITLEGNHLNSAIGLDALTSFQQRHGFDVFRIENGFDERRLMTSDGWDAYSPPHTLGRLDRVGAV